MVDPRKPLSVTRPRVEPAPLRPHKPVEIRAPDEVSTAPAKIADRADPENMPRDPAGGKQYSSATSLGPGGTGVRYYFAKTPEAAGFFRTQREPDGSLAYQEMPRGQVPPTISHRHQTGSVFIRVSQAAQAAAAALGNVVQGQNTGSSD